MTEKCVIRPRARTKDNEENLQRFSSIILEKYLRVLEIQLKIATSYYRQLFHKALSHHHFLVNPFSNGHVPFPCHHCQMENRTNRKNDCGPYRNKVQQANVMVG